MALQIIFNDKDPGPEIRRKLNDMAAQWEGAMAGTFAPPVPAGSVQSGLFNPSLRGTTSLGTGIDFPGENLIDFYSNGIKVGTIDADGIPSGKIFLSAPISAATQSALDGIEESIGGLQTSLEETQSTVSSLETALETKAPVSTTLTDAAASNVLPVAGSSESLVSLLQTVRNNIKAIFSGSLFSGAPSKSTPVDADSLPISNSASGGALNKLTFANLKAWLTSLFVSKTGDTLTGNLVVEANDQADVAVRAYGFANDGATMHGYQARGTKASPLPPTANDPIWGIGARPWTGTQWTAHSAAAIHMFARENITDTAQGTAVRVAVTPLGATFNERINAVSFECDGLGQGPRWRAKFSGALNQRGYIQDSTGNSTTVGILPGQAANVAGDSVLNLFSRSDPNNSSYIQLAAGESSSTWRLFSGSTGTGTTRALNITAATNGSYLQCGTDGKILLRAGASFGYGGESGGIVNQLTDKSTAVTLNKPCGRIIMSNSVMTAGTFVEFTLNNSLLTSQDLLIVNPAGVAGYGVEVSHFNSETAVVLRLFNRGATRSDAVQINFAIIRNSSS